jgi:NADH-quinone oxidoreductase subunit J
MDAVATGESPVAQHAQVESFMGFWEPLFFWIFALGAVITSLTVVVVRNPLYCALALVIDFFCFAGLYVLLSAHFMAVVQVLVYGGAIMVLFLFIIMLLNMRDDELGENRFSLHLIPAVLGTIGLLFFSYVAITQLVDRDAVEDARADARVALQAEGVDSVPVRTASRVPGLYADLNETALEAEFQRKVKAWDRGTETPADGKFRRFDPLQKFEIPESIKPERIEVVPGRTGLFGTFQPISAMLVNRFVVPFELTALLLLAAIVGAVIIAKRRVA